MASRSKGLVVTFEQPYDDEEVKELAKAIRLMKGVVAVDHIVEQRLNDAASRIARHPVAQAAVKGFVASIAAARRDAPELPAPVVDIGDDGAVIFEWRLPLRRMGLSFEADHRQSGWYYVDTREGSRGSKYGYLDNLDVDWLVAMVR